MENLKQNVSGITAEQKEQIEKALTLLSPFPIEKFDVDALTYVDLLNSISIYNKTVWVDPRSVTNKIMLI